MSVPTTCTATVTDTDGGTSFPVAGAVTFSTSGTGPFSSASCTSAQGVGTPYNASCQVTYTPGAEGTDTITAKYHDPSAGHTDSTGTAGLTVQKSTGNLNQYQPDAQVKATNGLRLGNGVYNTTGAGQIANTAVARGRTVALRVFVQNDGNAPDAFLLKGTGNHDGWLISYRFNGQDITRAVVAGRYRTASIAAGGSAVFKVLITAPRGAAIGRVQSWLLKATSAADTTKHDAVGMRVKVTA